MKGKLELNIWDRQKRNPLREHHFKVLSGKVVIVSKDYCTVIPAGRGLRIAWPYTMIAYEKSVVEYL